MNDEKQNSTTATSIDQITKIVAPTQFINEPEKNTSIQDIEKQLSKYWYTKSIDCGDTYRKFNNLREEKCDFFSTLKLFIQTLENVIKDNIQKETNIKVDERETKKQLYTIFFGFLKNHADLLRFSNLKITPDELNAALTGFIMSIQKINEHEDATS